MGDSLARDVEATHSECDIAISYAGEQDGIARELRFHLASKGFRVFDYKVTPIRDSGPALQERLKRLYSEESRTVVLLLSQEYFGPTKEHTTRVEFEAAKFAETEGAKAASSSYILPALVDRIALPRLPRAGTYYDLLNWREPNAIRWYADYVSDHIRVRPGADSVPEEPQERLHIMMVAPEYEGYNQEGGLGTAVAGLARGLAAAGHSVRVLVSAKSGDEGGEKHPLPKEVQPSIETLLRERRCGGVTLCWIESQQVGVFSYGYSPQRGGLRSTVLKLLGKEATQSQWSSQQRMQILEFSKQIPRVLELLRRSSDWCPQVIHVHDWPTCYVPAYARARAVRHPPRVVITIHNASHAGPLLPECGHTLLELGLRYADRIVTVSPNYAANLLNGHPCVDDGVLGILQRRGITGIVNGIEYDRLDPAPPHFSEMQDREILEWKTEAKRRLRKRLGIRAPDSALQVTFMHRCTEQKGFPEVMDALPTIQRMEGLQLLVVGPQDSLWDYVRVRSLRGRAKGVPRFIRSEEKVQVLAGSDVILMPSRFEPCGLTHLEGMHFGAVPLVTYVDGLADTVVPFDGNGGNALLVDCVTPEAIATALQHAVRLYRQQTVWIRLVRNAISEDFSWCGPRKSLAEYERTYRETLGDDARKEDTAPAPRVYKSGRSILVRSFMSNRWKVLAVLLLCLLWVNFARFVQVYHLNKLSYHLGQMDGFLQDCSMLDHNSDQENKFGRLKYYLGEDSYRVTLYSSLSPWEGLVGVQKLVDLGGRVANWPAYMELSCEQIDYFRNTWDSHENPKSVDRGFWLVDAGLALFAAVLLLLPKARRVTVEPLPGRPHLPGVATPAFRATEPECGSTAPGQGDSERVRGDSDASRESLPEREAG